MKLPVQLCNLIVLTAIGFSATSAFALEALSDKQLSQLSGQDGITLTVANANSTISFDQARWIDRGGFTSTYGANTVTATGDGTVTLAFKTYNAQNGISFLKSDGTPASQMLSIVADTDGGLNGAAFLNLAVALSSDLKSIHVSPFSLYLSNVQPLTGMISGSILNRDANGVITTPKSGAVEIVSVDNGADVTFIDGKPLAINVQLGNTPQGHFMLLGGKLQSINIPVLKLVSNNTSTANSSLSMGVNVAATDQVNGFNLGFYTDLKPTGVEVGYAGTTDKLNVGLTNITAGAAGQVSSAFNSIPNGAMGNIGVTGLQVQNLKVNIQGLN